MQLKKADTVIGFIGSGVMGKSMARNLMNEGYKLIIFSRTKAKAEELLISGAEWADSVTKLASKSDVIITMVGYPEDVREVYLGEMGIIANAKKGAYLIDMTTSTPALAKLIYQKALEHKQSSLDAPVSGGDIGAKNGKLTIMVGGEFHAFNKVKPIFEAMGENIVLQGEAGAGQHTKMCNQITIATTMVSVAEAMAYAKKVGLNPELVLKSIQSGAAGSWSLSNLAPRMIAGNYEPGFYIKHFIKDMTIALEASSEMELKTPGLQLAKLLYDELAARGEENSGTQALYKYYTEKV
jgi:3-hydroxyisobutyrate dehydrogenase